MSMMWTREKKRKAIVEEDEGWPMTPPAERDAAFWQLYDAEKVSLERRTYQSSLPVTQTPAASPASIRREIQLGRWDLWDHNRCSAEAIDGTSPIKIAVPSNAEGPGGNGVLEGLEGNEAIALRRLWWEQAIPDIPFEERKESEEDEALDAHLQRERESSLDEYDAQKYEALNAHLQQHASLDAHIQQERESFETKFYERMVRMRMMTGLNDDGTAVSPYDPTEYSDSHGDPAEDPAESFVDIVKVVEKPDEHFVDVIAARNRLRSTWNLHAKNCFARDLARSDSEEDAAPEAEGELRTEFDFEEDAAPATTAKNSKTK
jgi:hypothetical protein